jgi:hypothetical protein
VAVSVSPAGTMRRTCWRVSPVVSQMSTADLAAGALYADIARSAAAVAEALPEDVTETPEGTGVRAETHPLGEGPHRRH